MSEMKKKLTNVRDILDVLHQQADPDYVIYKQKKFGIYAENSLGVNQKKLNEIAKQIDKSDSLAIELFDTGVYEARILCSKIYNPKHLTAQLMERWVVTFENWEMCDSFCTKLFASSPPVLQKINDWYNREREFEKRAAFATIAGYTMANKTAPNSDYESFFPLIKSGSTDDRVYVKKAVDWALRSIGKRNKDLNKEAIACAKQLINTDNKTAQWIGRTSVKELQLENVRISDYPRSIYRPE